MDTITDSQANQHPSGGFAGLFCSLARAQRRWTRGKKLPLCALARSCKTIKQNSNNNNQTPQFGLTLPFRKSEWAPEAAGLGGHHNDNCRSGRDPLGHLVQPLSQRPRV